MFGHCTGFSVLISHVEQVENLVFQAFQAIMRESRPAHLSIPSDILAAPAGNMFRTRQMLGRKENVNSEAVSPIMEMVRSAKKPVFYIGHGCGSSIREISAFAEKIGASLICGPMGKRWIDMSNPRFKGVFGF